MTEPPWQVAHDRAVERGEATYADPGTGFSVFTREALLRNGICCGSGCRHCPYDHENVPPGGPTGLE